MTETNDRILEPRICESCGEEFGCGAKLEGCWCTDIELSPVAAEKLKANFGNCLCPDCLKKYASTDKTETPA